jgi:hypothetical protein
MAQTNQSAGHGERLENLTLLKTRTAKRAAQDRTFKRAIGTLGDDLAYIQSALEEDSEIWRLAVPFMPSMCPA